MQTRLSVRGLMLAVALAAVCLAAFRLHFSLGCFVWCVLSLALLRTSQAVKRLHANGLSAGRRTRLRLFLSSVAVSSTILVVSLLPSLCIIPIIAAPQMHHIPEFGREGVLGICVSAMLSIPIVTMLRRRLW